jgi:SAM-dependent methyltransferase
MAFTEAEIQALIALVELEQPVETPNNCHYAFHPKDLEAAQKYFHLSPLDLGSAFVSLGASGMVTGHRPSAYSLTPTGTAAAARLRRERPPIFYWYGDFYERTRGSDANTEYCRRVFGKDLCQDGFMDMGALHRLIEVTGIRAGESVLDLGCGNGLIAEYIADRTGAHVSGMDYIPEAISEASERTAARRACLNFQTGNMDAIPYPPRSFDVILAVDTLYMPNDLAETLRQLKAALRPGGCLGIFYSYALWEDPHATPADLAPERTPVGQALAETGFTFQSWDFTDADGEHARRKLEVIEELKDAFEREGNGFLYENRVATAKGVLSAIESGTHVRYLYLAQPV